MDIKNSVAIVTGGSSGLGEATVRKVVEAGGKAAIFDLNEENGRQLVSELGEDRTLFCKVDVSNEENVNEVLNAVVNKFGGAHIVVNCAGIATATKLLNKGEPHDLQLFSKIIQVNLIGTFNVIRLAANLMKENEANENGERGVIISTASIAAFEGQIGQVAYSASKGGVVGMTLPIARELARYGIRNITIAPGLFETPLFNSLPEEAKIALGKMVPFPSRLGLPSEYAQMVESIITNPMINGDTIRLDGAIRMQPK